jgi:hypothetical protein
MVPVQTELELASLKCDDRQSQRSPTHCSSGDEELASNMTAEYQEWPMRGFFKRTTIGNEIQYGMEFSLEQLQELYAYACPHASHPGSNRYFSTGSASSSRQPTQAKKIRSGPMSQSKRTRFTPEEDARLVNLKEKERWSWDAIEGAFPGRTRAALQVHYSTKLKDRASSSENGSERMCGQGSIAS